MTSYSCISSFASFWNFWQQSADGLLKYFNLKKWIERKISWVKSSSVWFKQSKTSPEVPGEVKENSLNCPYYLKFPRSRKAKSKNGNIVFSIASVTYSLFQFIHIYLFYYNLPFQWCNIGRKSSFKYFCILFCLEMPIFSEFEKTIVCTTNFVVQTLY